MVSERLLAAHGLDHHHFFLLTSGSTARSEADYKWVALKKSAILNAAAASNRFLEVTPQDVWFHTLPLFHVGGLSIYARARLSGSKVISASYERWNAHSFAEESAVATLASLVPTQVFDLVNAKIMNPGSLRAILVGGGALSPSLAEHARELGWPVLATYGLTETCSQVATQNLTSSPNLEILDHLEARQGSEGRIQVRGSSLLSGYITRPSSAEPTFLDPKDSEGWFTTEDVGEVQGRTLTITGRSSDRLKIGGELANLALLRQAWADVAGELSPFTALASQDDARLENVIVLITEEGSATTYAGQLNLAIEKFNDAVHPFERIRKTYVIQEIPRTELGKVKWSLLDELLSKQ
jgi:O-succinylbenzoic acid--CoA ligase